MTYEEACDFYHKSGDNLAQPSKSLSYWTVEGWWLENVDGPLARVGWDGAVYFDCDDDAVLLA